MKKIGLLHKELSKVIAQLAHEDMILIGDAGMPVLEGVRTGEFTPYANIILEADCLF